MNTNKQIQEAIEMHLFYARLMRDHTYFLASAFQSTNVTISNQFKEFLNGFNNILSEALLLSGGGVSSDVLHSGELITVYTLDSETRSDFYTNIRSNTDITIMEQQLVINDNPSYDPEMDSKVHNLNSTASEQVNSILTYLNLMLNDITNCNMLFFPSLIRHYQTETSMYQFQINIMKTTMVAPDALSTVKFWNSSLADHTMFTPSQVDITETHTIYVNNQYSRAFEYLINMGNMPYVNLNQLVGESLYYVTNYRDFMGTKVGEILACTIYTIVLPIMGDHLLREANHYIRLLRNIAPV